MSDRLIILGIPNDTDRLRELGCIAIQHGQVDHLLRMYLRDLQGWSVQEARKNLRRVTTGQLIQRILRLAAAKLPEEPERARLFQLLARVRAVVDQRNEVFHTLWGWSVDEDKAVIQNAEHEWEESWTADHLALITVEMSNALAALVVGRQDGFLQRALVRTAGIS